MPYAALLAEVDPDVVQALEDARYVVLCTVPFAFLAGLLRSRVAEATAVSEVVARLGDPSMRRTGICHALADALEGTSLELAYSRSWTSSCSATCWTSSTRTASRSRTSSRASP